MFTLHTLINLLNELQPLWLSLWLRSHLVGPWTFLSHQSSCPFGWTKNTADYQWWFRHYCYSYHTKHKVGNTQLAAFRVSHTHQKPLLQINLFITICFLLLLFSDAVSTHKISKVKFMKHSSITVHNNYTPWHGVTVQFFAIANPLFVLIPEPTNQADY